MIYISDNKSILCKGDFHPAQFYKGKKKISGYETASFEGEKKVILENCYNDRLYNAKIYGNEQGVGDLAEEGEYAGKYKIGIVARGKNLFKFLKSSVQNATTVEVFENGAVVQGKTSETAAADSYARGWFSPGYAKDSAINPVFKGGETVTVSADITLTELMYGDSYRPVVMLVDKSGNAASRKGSVTTYYITEGKKARMRQSFGIGNLSAAKEYYPAFTLNSNIVRIENIQIEISENKTEYEDYKEPKTFDIFLDEPIGKVDDTEEYIDFEEGVVVRSFGTEPFETFEIPTFKGTTVYEIETQVSAKISGEYKRG